MCCQVFDLLAIAALIDDNVLCIHGGLSPYIKTLDKIREIRRNKEIPNRGGFCGTVTLKNIDLLWSDPEEVDGWELSPRGAGWLFGESITRGVLIKNFL
ncbi:hypothetical protein HZS_2546 [Henneguya salminicola]|nr:hypothetical protein HZS_2546 [Henneguya salminicola]